LNKKNKFPHIISCLWRRW